MFLYVSSSLISVYRLFIAEESVSVVLQNDKGEEVHFTVGAQEDADMSWDEFQESSKKDFESQDFLKTESDCLGVLGDRMLMQIGRINQAGEVYMEAFFLVTLNDAGKITMLESFSNVNASNLMDAAKIHPVV